MLAVDCAFLVVVGGCGEEQPEATSERDAHGRRIMEIERVKGGREREREIGEGERSKSKKIRLCKGI